MALKCYPLQPGGLLAIEAVPSGSRLPRASRRRSSQAFPVILLLIFMVAGIYFLRDLLLFVFTPAADRCAFARRCSSLLFCVVAAVLSAFLDALTVIAVVVTVGLGFYEIYHRVASGKGHDAEHDATADDARAGPARDDARPVPRVPARAHDACGRRHRDRRRHHAGRRAAEPADRGARRLEFRGVLPRDGAGRRFRSRSPGWRPAAWSTGCAGSATERSCRTRCARCCASRSRSRAARLSARDRYAIVVQAVVAVLLVLALAFHVADVGLIGLHGDRARDVVDRRHRRAPARQGVRGGVAVHGAAGRVLCDRRRDPRSASVRAADPPGTGARGSRCRPRCSISRPARCPPSATTSSSRRSTSRRSRRRC